MLEKSALQFAKTQHELGTTGTDSGRNGHSALGMTIVGRRCFCCGEPTNVHLKSF